MVQDLTALKAPFRNNLMFRGVLHLLPGMGGGYKPQFPILSSEGGFAISFCLWSLCSLAVGQQFLCLGCLLAGGRGRVLGTARGSAGRVRGQAGAARGGVGGLQGAGRDREGQHRVAVSRGATVALGRGCCCPAPRPCSAAAALGGTCGCLPCLLDAHHRPGYS